MKKQFAILGFFLCLYLNSNSQSTSVFDANYFNKDNAQPPIKVGKGFHINDVYKQTKYCFSAETCGKEKLIRQQNAAKTTINLYYTEDDEQFHLLQNQGASGKISFLSLFSVGGSKLKEFTTKTFHDIKRLIFVAKVDFGVYSFDRDPALEPEAKALIEQDKHADFIQMYGTHYISGVRKESSIWVILKIEESSEETSETEGTSVGVSGKIPFKGKGSFEINQGSETEKILNSHKYSVSIEINGPALEKNTLKQKINTIVNGKVQNKLAAITEVIEEASSKISDESQSMITQYYYTPFSLYNVKGINWDERKQGELVKINENVIHVYTKKTALDEMLTPTAKDELIAEYNEAVPDFSKKSAFQTKLVNKYNEILPALKGYQTQINSKLDALEKKYKSCSDITCNQETTCCQNNSILTECTMLTYNIDKELSKLDDIFEKASSEAISEALTKALEEMTPECEKEKKGYIIIYNKSTNPYELYQGDKFIEEIEGGGSRKYLVEIGTYYFKASQKSGYLMYPTVNNRKANITSVCEEFTIKIGFED